MTIKIHLLRFVSSVGKLSNESVCGKILEDEYLDEDVNNVTCKNCLKGCDY